MIIAVTIIIAFLCGSIPTGYLIVKKLYGIDIRTIGSGNIGSTNVKRIAGRKISIITQISDISKGLLPVLTGMYLAVHIKLSISTSTYLSIIAMSVILGHDYTPFLSFNGGKGVNTTLGAFFLISPIPTLSGVVAYFALKLATNIVSIRSIALGITIAAMTVIMKLNASIKISAVAACILMIIRHKDNLRRIFNKQES